MSLSDRRKTLPQLIVEEIGQLRARSASLQPNSSRLPPQRGSLDVNRQTFAAWSDIEEDYSDTDPETSSSESHDSDTDDVDARRRSGRRYILEHLLLHPKLYALVFGAKVPRSDRENVASWILMALFLLWSIALFTLTDNALEEIMK